MFGDLLIKNGTVIRGSKSAKADVLLKGGRIEAVEPDIPSTEIPVFDARGCIVSPGFCDIHVHLREPGFTAKETIRSGTAAASRGGYTTVCPMPNLNPVPDAPRTLAVELAAIERDALVRVLPYCSITLGRKGLELVDMAALKGSCVAFSDDGSGVQDADVMLRAMELAAREDCIIAAHCELNELLHGGYIHDGRWCAAHGHKGICSRSEWGEIERDIELARRTDCRYHVCHISCAESVELIRRAKADGVRITCETAPHYLALCEDDMQEDGRFKMNPPLRRAEDRDALIGGLLDGTIDAIATDHAPHTAEEKSRGLAGSAMGVVGLETAFPVLYTTLVRTGRVPLERIIELLTDSPRRIFNIPGGRLRPGDAADLTIVDIGEIYRIDSSGFLSKGHSTPFDGMEVQGKVIAVFKDGKKIV